MGLGIYWVNNNPTVPWKKCRELRNGSSLRCSIFFPALVVATSIWLLTGISAWAATYTVNNATDFNNLPRLNAGDVVQMNSGTYGAINKTLESTIADDTTAKSNPILVYALTPGGVVVNAPSKITLSGRGIILAGLDFGPNSGIMTGSSYMVATATASRYMTLSNLRFNGCAAGANDGHWLYIQGFSCSIEFCTFTERPEISSNSTVSFMPNITEGGVTVPRLHRLSYCYFGPRYVGMVNGFEAIRIGVGDAQTYDMQVTIEHNLFYRSIWRNDLTSGGEPEIISNKSKGNKILYNTILESQGGICLRSGDYGTVEGNFIFGAGSLSGTNIVLGTALASQNGIRVIGQNHVIRNNYIENITGTDIHAALCLMSGESDYYPGNPTTGATNNGSYAPAHNAQIYNNSFINCREISLGFLSSDSYTNSSGTYVAKSPTNVLFYNNAWQGNGTTTAALVRETSNVTGYSPIVLGGSGGNYVYEPGSSAKLGWTNGISNSTFTILTSPAISSNFDNYKVPTSTSPLLDKASNTLVAAYDVRGLARPTNNQDIGSFERSVTGSGFKPLLRTNVGTGFDGGPTNSYPQAGSGDSKPTILTTTIQSASVGTAYSQTLQSSGGDGILTWSISAGSLPTGLSLLPGSGVISGTPGANSAGTYTFTAKITDSDAIGPDSAEQSYTLTVYSAGGAKLSIGTVAAYSSASGTKSSYSYDGKTGTRWSSLVTSKNPNSAGTNFGTDCTWIRWDLGDNKTLSSIKLNWYNGSTRSYNYRLDSTTNTNSWSTILTRTNSVTNGLTNGYETVSLSGASGRYVRLVCWGNSTSNGYAHINEVEIYGSAYVAPDSRKTQSIVFGALGSVLESDPPMALSAYSLSASNTYTDLPITYESSDPSVAAVDGTTMTITGSGSTWITASQQGDTNYQAAAPVQQLLTVTPLSPVITSATSATAVRGLPFRFQIAADRPVTGFGATGLPAGLTMDAASGKIIGTASASGSYAVTVSAQNVSGTGTTTLNLNVIDPFVYETFESYTNGQGVPLASPTTLTSGIKATGQVTNAAGNSVIGTGGKVAWFNDTTTATSAQLEFNGGASGQSYLAASFELYNNATPAASGTMPLIISFAAWNTGNSTTVGGSSSKRIAALEINQFGSLTAPSYSIKGVATNSYNYTLANKQTFHLFANDHDTNTINYVGPDGNVRTLPTNSFAVFLNSGLVGVYGMNPTATANDGTTILTGNNNLGRLCFNTSTANTANWFIDNVVVSDMPTDVVVPPPAAPSITSPSTASGQAGSPFTYTTTNLELADVYTCDGVLPTGLTFSTASGSITGTPNQSGTFPVTIYASNDAGAGTLALALTIAPAPPNIFSGTDPSLNTAASWSLGAAPNASSSGGSYTDLVFNSSATNLTTSSGNINGKSWNVTNGSNYFLSSVRDTNSAGGTLYKIGNTGTNDTTPFTNTVTGVENEMVYLTNNSSLTLSSQSISNSIPAAAQLRNSGIVRIAAGSICNLACSVGQSSASSAYAITKRGGGKLILSGSNSYTGVTTVEQGTLALSGSGTSPTTIKTGAVLEVALTNPASLLGAGLTLELGAQVRIVGTPASGQTYPLATASAVTNHATLETSIPGFQLSVSGSSLVLMPAGLINPTITWSNPDAITYGTPLSSTQLNASSSAAGTFSYIPAAGAVLPAGTNSLQVVFSATDTNIYLSPVTNNVSLVVNKATPVISMAPTASPINNGQALVASTLTGGAASVAGSFAFTAPGTVPGVGTSTQSVTFTPADAANYNSATTSVSVLVNQAVVSSDASLINLTLSSGILSPTFSSNTASYTATVSNLLAMQITPTVSQSNATVKVNGVNVASGSASGKIKLLPGTNTITTVVTAQDGTTSKTYTVAVTQNDEFDTLRSRWQATLISNGLAASSVSSIGSKAYGFWKTNAAALNTNATSADAGLWSDLPMDARDATASGNMVTSFSRLYKMAQAYVTPGCTVVAITVTNGSTNTNTVTLTGNSELGGALVKGMDWMVANIYTTNGVSYGNWFDWEVQGAQYFTDAQTLMYAQLSADQILNYAKAIDNYGPNSVNMQDYFFWGALTGANTTSVALVAAVNGIVSKDAAKIAEINAAQGVPKVFPLVTDGDGFYADGSYIFHGNVAYNGHYGMVMLEGVVTLATLLDGSTWTIYDPLKFPNVYTWITKGFQPFFYRGAFMDCVRGRSVGTSGETGASVGTELLGYIQKVAGFTATPGNLATAYNAFVANPHPATGQYHFPNMDRVVAHRANYSFAISMSSTRVNNYEDLFGDANTKGYFQGDGMTYLYVGSTDTQFVNGYWPSVDIYHLTGTTTEQGTVSTPSATDQHFVGGADVRNTAGNATYGVAAFSLHPKLKTGTSTLNAKKSYFMLENEVICLGAGITAGSTNEIHTTVENRALGTNVSTATLWVDGASTSRSLASSSVLANPSNCAIEGLGGYHFFDNPGNLQAAFQQSSGTWGAIHPGDSDTAIYTNNYLKLYYKHGVRPTNATYAYAILPTMTPAAVAAYSRNPQTTILSNNSSVQAVKNATLGVVAASFWGASGGAADFLTANKACSVIAYETGNGISVGISDPSQTLSGSNGVITVTLNRAATGTIAVDDGVTVVRTSPTIQLQADVSGMKGSTLHASFSLEAAPVITGNLNLVAQTGTAVSHQITSDTSGATYGATGLPPGLSLYGSGLIYGTPAASGTYTATISATNAAGRTGYATLTIQVADTVSSISSTFGSSTTWVCPANVTAVQVEAWGAGGAGGSASRTGGSNAVQYGGGGAGGAYAKTLSIPVVSGVPYYINVGTCSSNSSAVASNSVTGGDSWFSSSNGPSSLILAKGGAGGNSAIGNTTATAYATAGFGTTNGSIGNVLYAGGSGANGLSGFAGGGGSGAASTTNGVTATNNIGAVSPAGGGTGGTGVTSGSLPGGGGTTPGGGGAGARNSSGTVSLGGAGGAGQVVLTIKSLGAATNPVATFALTNLIQTYDGSPKGVIVTTEPTGLPYSLTFDGSITVPSQAGVYQVVALPLDSNYSGGITNSLTIQKATPAILSLPTASAITSGQTLASSMLSGGSGSTSGAFAWTTTSTVPGASGSFEVTFTPTDTTNYNTATGSVAVTVNSAGESFNNLFGGVSATNVGSDGLTYLLKYALGGTNTNDKVTLPTVSVSGTTLTLSAIIRTNDTNLTIVGQSVTSLSAIWSNLATNSVGTASTNTNNVPEGCQRREFTVDGGTNERALLRLKATQNP